jgi:hypothetical protein
MNPRIMLISALAQSPAPAVAAMRDEWPEARCFNLLDESLSSDLEQLGGITDAIFDRFLKLGRYAAAADDGQGPARGIMFTCSAFGPAIDRVKADLSIPVIAPNEGAFEEALDICAARDGGGRIGLLLTFAGSLAPLSAEMDSIADARGQRRPEIVHAVADGALAALQKGDPETHDRLIAEAAGELPPVDVLLLGQFSMARAAGQVAAIREEPVLTTPHAAARKLRAMVEGR